MSSAHCLFESLAIYSIHVHNVDIRVVIIIQDIHVNVSM